MNDTNKLNLCRKVPGLINIWSECMNEWKEGEDEWVSKRFFKFTSIPSKLQRKLETFLMRFQCWIKAQMYEKSGTFESFTGISACMNEVKEGEVEWVWKVF